MNQLSARGTMAASCMIFFALGVITGALGLALPDLAANASSSLATIGAIFTALFLGGFIMQLIAGSLNDRLGQRPVLLGIGLLTRPGHRVQETGDKKAGRTEEPAVSRNSC